MASNKLRVRGTSALAAAFPFLVAAFLAGCTEGGLNLGILFPVANQHPSGFVTQHGRIVQLAGGPDKAKVENGMTCTMCHATAKNADGSLPKSSRGSAVTCLQCHKGGPDGNPGHPADFRATHGDLVQAAGSVAKATFDGKTCATCHTTEKAADGSVPKSKVSNAKDCFACHPGGPSGSPAHPSDWIATHGDTVLAGGGPQAATVNGVTCTSCHAASKDADGNVVASPQKRAAAIHCYLCHKGGPDGEPAHPSGYKAEHGAEVLAAGGFQQAKFGGISCSTCHAAAKDSAGSVVASPQKKAKDKTCFSCHEGGPTGSPAHPSGWTLSGHGAYVKANGGPGKATSGRLTCAACHTTAKAADGSIPASPMSTAKTCFTCHVSGPPTTN